jgi:O-antigen/teichoic acid export membrane protein
MTIHEHDGKGLLARNSLFNLAGQILPLLVGVVTIPYIVKGLGTVGFGILSITWMVLGYFSMFDLGLSRATTKFVAAHLSPDKIDRVPALIWTSLALQLGLGFAGGLLVAPFVPFAVTRLFTMPTAFVADARTSLLLLCASIPVLLGSNALRGVLEAAQRFDLVNYVKVPASITFYLLAALAIPFGVGVSGIVLLSVLSRVIAAGAYLALCYRVFPQLRMNSFSISREVIRPLVTFGGWVMITNAAGPVFIYLERFMIATLLPVSMLSFYSAPFELVSRVIIFPASIAPALFPYFSYHGGRPGTVVSDVASRSVKFLLLVMTPITAVFVFFARDVLQFWLGPQFASQSTEVLQILAIAFFLNGLSIVPFTSVQALGRPDLKALLDLFLLPTYALCCWVLMRRMGINGAALAKLFITILDTTFLFAFAWRMKSFSVRDCISGPLSRALLASGGLLFVVFVIGSFHSRVALSVMCLTACFLCYIATCWFVALDDADKITMRGLSRQLSPRSKGLSLDTSLLK